MADFDFSTLNSSDLERLVCDLLNAQERSKNSEIRFKTFKEVMLRQLKKEEKPKVDKLAPERYLFATSIDLSVQNSIELVNLFIPYLAGNDIYGRQELNRLLDTHHEVLTSHFKLWFSSSAVLQKMLAYEVIGRSAEFTEYDLKRRLRLYVETPALSRARDRIRTENILILSGEPGVGKTTTAEILLYEFINDGYSLTYILDDIKEAEKTYRPDDSKQIFYFDDFLGHTQEEIRKSKGSETALIQIFKLVSRRPSKKLILSTRSFILNGAMEASERLRTSQLSSYATVVELCELSWEDKSQLLRNHIEESEISDELKYVLRQADVHDFIITHANFSPRSIEFITSSNQVSGFSPGEFKKFIQKNFNLPDKIWRHAYEQQIDENDRILLNTMTSFGDTVHVSVLERAFDARIDYEIAFGGHLRSMNCFSRSMQRLSDGFIVRDSYFSDGNYRFINPSLIDFLISCIKGISGEATRIANSAVTLDQLTPRLFPISVRANNLETPSLLADRLIDHWETFVDPDNVNYSKLTLAILTYYYVKDGRKEEFVCSQLAGITDWSFIAPGSEPYIAASRFIAEVSSDSVIRTLCGAANGILSAVIGSADNLDEGLINLHLVLNKFDQELLSKIALIAKIELEESFTYLINVKIADRIDKMIEYKNAVSAVRELETEISETQITLHKAGLTILPDMASLYDYEWQLIENDKYLDQQMHLDD
ncbi:ATP-binding protein [Nostocales cyanobacterium LEGE 12452]|nr:ATP-binding protein [Nostocales cyanobacterium LEGE 12452]